MALFYTKNVQQVLITFRQLHIRRFYIFRLNETVNITYILQFLQSK